MTTLDSFGSEPGAMPCTGDDCYCSQGLPVHPPVLMTFDPRRGEYVAPTDERCLARWASGGYGDHLTGQICGRAATEEVGDTWVCDHHYKRAVKWVNETGVRDHEAAMRRMCEGHAEQMRLDRERAAQQIELAKERIRAEEAARAEYSLVYYVQRTSDGIIKIGTSRGIVARMAALRRVYGPLRLLATHGGTHIEEHAIHDRFDALLAEGTEWFLPALPLLEHIRETRRRHETLPDPALPPLVTLPELRKMIRQLKQARTGTETAALRVRQYRCQPVPENGKPCLCAGQSACRNAVLSLSVRGYPARRAPSGLPTVSRIQRCSIRATHDSPPLSCPPGERTENDHHEHLD